MASVRELVERFQPELVLRRFGRVVDDTSEFMSIGPGDVIAVNGCNYLVHRDAVERGSAYKDTKFWVKKCMELETGAPKLLKLVFHESFYLQYGNMRIKCYRSPHKEARMLDRVHGDMRYMQGCSVRDTAGNLVRIIDIISGKRIDLVLASIKVDHAEYFKNHFPYFFRQFIGACQAISDLHAQDEVHGDINLDHLMREHTTNDLRWIDFDYAYGVCANPFALDLFGLGRILACITGKQLYTNHNLREAGFVDSPSLCPADFSCVRKNEVMNLRALFPYVPEFLNRILLHFSQGAEIGYDSVEELIEDMQAVKL
ncbi:serine/threonine protein kinase [uncultured Pseudodesulfovibrio sp.]|uniref:serine/threonine protein kinase n=1 Tax=uncultured Pseudodesulfovibrio sp. TaxID=2035858 RepID=UPI0029C7B4A1|nr:serine/threonine protein kinase [uncultured Pseudodesulfovibrio sp.]